MNSTTFNAQFQAHIPNAQMKQRKIILSESTKNPSQRNIKTSSDTLDLNRRLSSRRYQPYQKPSPTSQDSTHLDPLFGPIISPTLTTTTYQPPSTNSNILQDYEIFDEFDHFIHSPTRFLSSPPPSPSLSPSDDDDDLDFGDFPLFP